MALGIGTEALLTNWFHAKCINFNCYDPRPNFRSMGLLAQPANLAFARGELYARTPLRLTKSQGGNCTVL